MSYILEALKKSEQERERERGALPDIKSVHAPSSVLHRGERRWWPFILVAVIVVASAGLTVFYLKNTSPLSQQVQIEQPSISSSKQSPVAEVPVRQEPEKAARQVPDPEVSRPATTPRNTVAPVEQKKQSVVFSKQPLERDDVIGNLDEQREQAEVSKVKPEKKGSSRQDSVVAISDIPDNIRKKIPNIAFEGHVYSSVPGRRSIMVNGHKRREGDTIGDDLLVREITGEGAEFEFQGYRFRLNALQDWSFK